MLQIQQIAESINAKTFRVSDHADEEAYSDSLTFDEIYAAVRTGEIIEQYPDDKPYPSCLIYGRNKNGEPIHSVWAYNVETKSSVLITVYRPDPERWIDWKQRRKP
ncbi:MAG: DUF4258 domain-containing protein [Nitrospirota bacterium]|nr:DUF4258 domain-containing protein [Nitrospirota bacterium]